VIDHTPRLEEGDLRELRLIPVTEKMRHNAPKIATTQERQRRRAKRKLAAKSRKTNRH
jgi:hypothetical protein